MSTAFPLTTEAVMSPYKVFRFVTICKSMLIASSHLLILCVWKWFPRFFAPSPPQGLRSHCHVYCSSYPSSWRQEWHWISCLCCTQMDWKFLATTLFQSLNRKIISMVTILLWECQYLQVPSQARVFLECSPYSQLFFSCCPLFRECDQDTSQGQVNHLGASSHTGNDSRGLNLWCKLFSCCEEGMQWEPCGSEDGVGNTKIFKAAFSSLPSLLIDSQSWRSSYGPNQMSGCCCQKPLLPPLSPLFSLLTLQLAGTFLPLLRFSLPISITSFNLLCPLLLSILFFSFWGKEGALASQLFICKYFLCFCPDLAKFGVLQEQETEPFLFPSGILTASFLASKAVYKTDGKLAFLYPCCKTCFIIVCLILKSICSLNPPNM